MACICLIMFFLISKSVAQPDHPINAVVSLGRNHTMSCKPLKNHIVWKAERFGDEVIFDGSSVLQNFKRKYTCIIEGNWRRDLVMLEVGLPEADRYECVKDELDKRKHFNAIVVASDHRNIKCSIHIDDNLTADEEVELNLKQRVSIECFFEFEPTRYCTPQTSWRDVVSGDVIVNEGLSLKFEHNNSEKAHTRSQFSLSVAFICESTTPLHQKTHANNKPEVKDIYQTPTFLFLFEADRSDVTSSPSSKPGYTVKVEKSMMMITMIVVASIIVVLFLILVSYICLTRRKFQFNQQDSLVMDYMRPRSAAGPQSSLNHTPSNIIMTDNVAFKRQANCLENSYNVQNSTPLTTTNPSSLPYPTIAYHLQSQVLQQMTPQPSSLQAPSFPTHSLQNNPSQPYQPLTHSPTTLKQYSIEDLYDTILDPGPPSDHPPTLSTPLPKPSNSSTPTLSTHLPKPSNSSTPTLSTHLPKPSNSSTPTPPTNATNHLLKSHRENKRPDSIPFLDPPLPPLSPLNSLGVYLIPEHKTD